MATVYCAIMHIFAIMGAGCLLIIREGGALRESVHRFAIFVRSTAMVMLQYRCAENKHSMSLVSSCQCLATVSCDPPQPAVVPTSMSIIDIEHRNAVWARSTLKVLNTLLFLI